MALQMRPDMRQGGSGDAKWYSPGRDLLHLMPSLLKAIIEGLNEEDPWLSEFLNRGGDSKEIDKAAMALVTFIGLSEDNRDPVACYLKAGLDDVSPEALDMFARRILRAFLGVFHKGVGSIVDEKEVFPETVEGYIGSSMRLISEWRWLNTPWWRRLLIKANRIFGRQTKERKELW